MADDATSAVDEILRESGETWRSQHAPRYIRRRLSMHEPAPSRPTRGLRWALPVGAIAALIMVGTWVSGPEQDSVSPLRLKAVSAHLIRAPSMARLRTPGPIVAPTIPSAPSKLRRPPTPPRESETTSSMESDDVV
ncbi:MAG: hypothetical protein AAFN07_12585 [Pseudomonadota bacterium]